MTLAAIMSRTQLGLEAALVPVEVHVGGGLPAFSIVGLPETVVKESKDRVRAALANCGFELPAGHITVNLAPADLPKEGGRFDLPIACGILVASGQQPAGPFEGAELYGELSLGGDRHAIRGVLPTALQGTRAGHTIILPAGNLDEAALARNDRILGAAHLLDVCVAGCYVLDGFMSRASDGLRIIRDNIVAYEGKISSLKRFKEDVKEVQTGYECGIMVENFNDLKVGDIIENYIIEKIAAKL